MNIRFDYKYWPRSFQYGDRSNLSTRLQRYVYMEVAIFQSYFGFSYTKLRFLLRRGSLLRRLLPSLSDRHSRSAIRVKVIIRPLAASTQISDSEYVAEPRYDEHVPARSQRNAALALRGCTSCDGYVA